MRIVDMVLAFPALILAMAIAAAPGSEHRELDAGPAGRLVAAVRAPGPGPGPGAPGARLRERGGGARAPATGAILLRHVLPERGRARRSSSWRWISATRSSSPPRCPSWGWARCRRRRSGAPWSPRGGSSPPSGGSRPSRRGDPHGGARRELRRRRPPGRDRPEASPALTARPAANGRHRPRIVWPLTAVARPGHARAHGCPLSRVSRHRRAGHRTTPGPDTALTIRNTLSGGRPAGLGTALGVAAGQAVWTVAASAGDRRAARRVQRRRSRALGVAGAAYLAWLGIQALWAAVRPGIEVLRADDRTGLCAGSSPAAAFPAGASEQPGESARWPSPSRASCRRSRRWSRRVPRAPRPRPRRSAP